jgi:hypothetical protein
VTASVVGEALSCEGNSSLCIGTQGFAFVAMYDALARKAKVAFTDIQMEAAGRLSPPADLAGEVLEPAYKEAKARVLLLTWGCLVQVPQRFRV